MNMDSLLNASGLSGQQLPNNHFVDSQVTEKLEFFVVVSKLLSKNLNFHNYFLICVAERWEFFWMESKFVIKFPSITYPAKTVSL